MDVDERGVYAQRNIPSNTTLASIPFDSLLTIHSANAYPVLKYLQASQIREDDLLAVLLLIEKGKMEQSKWYHHIRYLPKEYHSILNFSEDELETIQGSNLYLLTKTWKTQVESDFKELQAMIASYVVLHPSIAQFFSSFSFQFEDYLWALCTIWSRFISIQYVGQLVRAMVPFVDFLNHSPKAHLGHKFDERDGRFYLINSQQLKKDEEIFLSYGNNSNSRLLMLYGFTLLYNPHSSISIYASMEEPDASKKLEKTIYSLKRKVLTDHGIPVDQKESFVLQLNQLPNELLIFLRLQHLPKDKFMKDFHAINERIGTMVSNENEITALNELEKVLRSILAQYPRSLAEDEKELQDLGYLPSTADTKTLDSPFIHPRNHRVHGLILPYSEKQVIHSILKLLKERRDSLQ